MMTFKKSVQKHVFQLYHVVNDTCRSAQLSHSQGGLDELQRKYQCNKVLTIGQQNQGFVSISHYCN